MALSTGSLYVMGLDRAFEMAAAAGYDGVELLVDAREDSFDVPYLRRLSERTGMPVLSVHTPFMRHIAGWPEAQEERIGRTLQLAEALGAEAVIAHTPGRWHHLHIEATLMGLDLHLELPWSPAAEDRYARWLESELARVQESTPIRIAIENMPAGRVWGRQVGKYRYNRPEELRRWPHLVLDTTHWGTWGVEPLQAYDALKDRVAHVHLSDYDGREHRLPFSGRQQLAGLLAALARDRFGGIVAVELNPWAIADGDWGQEALLAPLRDTAVRCRNLLCQPSSHSHRLQMDPAASFSSDGRE